MRIFAALLTVAALAGLAFAGDCTPYRRPAYSPSRTYTPHVEHDDVIVFTQFQIVQPAPGVVATTPAAAPAPSSAPNDDGPPVVTSAATVSGNAGPPGGAVDLLRVSCAKCHGGGKSSGGVTIFSPDGRFAPNRDAGELYDQVASGAMPPTGKLSAADKKALRQLLLAAR